MTGDTLATEQKIQQTLKASGQLDTMRAMIVEASLQTLVKDQIGGAKKLFHPADSLVKTREDPQGRLALSVVAQYLDHLGLQYTSRVLRIETGMEDWQDADNIADALHITTSPVLPSLLARGVQTSKPTAVPTAGGQSVPGALPVPEVDTAFAVVPSNATPGGILSGTNSSFQSDRSTSQGTVTESGHDGSPVSGAGGPGQGEALPGAQDDTYFISKWKNKTFYRFNQVKGQQVQVEYLTNCTMVVLDALDSMTVDDCEGGELIVAACEGSIFLRNCSNMTVHAACKQLRTRDCNNVDLRLLTTTDPVVEMSHHMTFRPFHLRLPLLTDSLRAARLDPNMNRFVHVYDFTVDEPSLPQPHFTVLYPNHSVVMEDRYADRGALSCPQEVEDLLIGKLMPAASSESGQNKSYDIKSGAALWAGGANSDDTVAASKGDRKSLSTELPSDNTGAASSATSQPQGVTSGRPPPVPSATVPTAQRASSASTSDDGESDNYSSFHDDSEESGPEDKIDVDEDDDDF